MGTVAVAGMVAVSNYDCDQMDEWYRAPKWLKHVSPARTIHSTKDKRAEVLWTNYETQTDGWAASDGGPR